jgi:catechol 2,3-dioxygenase-like lactoylglutathione lyase family enzyme
VTAVRRIVEWVRPVSDLARAVRFYADALGFVDAGQADAPALLATAWGVAPSAAVRMRLGGQSLLLAACGHVPQPPDAGADDLRFQHLAVIAGDMRAAWQRVEDQGPVQAISRGGPQLLPASSGGVTAIKFRDPDGHPLELLGFPAHAVPPQWARAGAGLTLGIDHSAIAVADAPASIEFYRHHLGLRLGSRQVNQGPEQARLDGLAEPRVDVVALAPAEASSPHLELLGYHPARPPAAAPGGPRTTTIWSGGVSTPSWLADPDGHPHLLVP